MPKVDPFENRSADLQSGQPLYNRASTAYLSCQNISTSNKPFINPPRGLSLMKLETVIDGTGDLI